MIVKKTMETNRVLPIIFSSVTLFPPIALMISSYDGELLKVIAADKTILFVSGAVLTIHLLNDIKSQFKK